MERPVDVGQMHQLHLKMRCGDNYFRDVAHGSSNISKRQIFSPLALN